MPELNPLSNDQIFLKKIAENTGSNYNTGDVSEINPLTIDQILLKEIAANTTGLEEKVSDTQDMLSDAYDSTHTYNVGDYCIYEDVLYKCNTASTTGTWDSSKWDVVTVLNEIENIPKIKIGQMYYEEVAVSTVYQGFYFGYTDYITNHGNQGVLIAYRVQADQATAPYSIVVVENRLELLSATSQTVKLTWAPVYI